MTAIVPLHWTVPAALTVSAGFYRPTQCAVGSTFEFRTRLKGTVPPNAIERIGDDLIAWLNSVESTSKTI